MTWHPEENIHNGIDRDFGIQDKSNLSIKYILPKTDITGKKKIQDGTLEPLIQGFKLK